MVKKMVKVSPEYLEADNDKIKLEDEEKKARNNVINGNLSVLISLG